MLTHPEQLSCYEEGIHVTPQPPHAGDPIAACAEDMARLLGLRHGSLRLIYRDGRPIAVAPTYRVERHEQWPSDHPGTEDHPLARRLMDAVGAAYTTAAGCVSIVVHDGHIQRYLVEPWYSHDIAPPPLTAQPA